MGILAALVQGSQASKAAYYAARRENIKAAQRTLLFGLGFCLVAATCFGLSLLFPETSLAPAVKPALEPTPTIAQIAPTIAPSPTQPPPTATKITPSATPPEPTPTTIPDTPTPAASAIPTTEPALKLRVISPQITQSGEPLGGGSEFTQPVKSIYIFYEFHNLPPGQILSHDWVRGGVAQYHASDPLKISGDGIANVAWSPAGGFTPGLYEVRFTLNTRRVFVANFVVR